MKIYADENENGNIIHAILANDNLEFGKAYNQFTIEKVNPILNRYIQVKRSEFRSELKDFLTQNQS